MKWLLLFMLPAIASAQVVRVDVIHRTNAARGLNRQDAKAVFAAATKQIAEETGVRLRVRRWSAYPVRTITVPPRPGFFGPHGYGVAASDLVPDSLNPARITLVISPRYRWDGAWWNGGRAAICGDRALAIVGRLKRYGGNALLHAQTVIAHELGHALGAEHDYERCSVMLPDAGTALATCGWQMSFSGQAITQIRECMAK